MFGISEKSLMEIFRKVSEKGLGAIDIDRLQKGGDEGD